MIQVMAALRKLVGIIGSGFEMVQDFIDEIFQGILPASFVAKYATQGFQSAMEARYSQPTSSKNDRGQARKNVPTMANARPVSRISRVRNSFAMAGKYTGKILGAIASSPVGKATTALAIASMAVGIGYEIYNDVASAERDRLLAEMWPENFTLFGYDDVVNKFDDLESFLLEDSSCYTLYQYERLNLTMQMVPCLDSKLRRYAEANPLAGTTSIDATQCWADATPSLGQNSLFACTSTSTCCVSATECQDGKRIPCGTCAEPSLALTNKYGCHSSLRKCVCGNPRTTVDRCSANMHCDAEAQCELVSSLNSISYGGIPCKLCPSNSRVVCLLDAEKGMPGRCVCVTESSVQLDLCRDSSGMETGVDSSRLCGYLHGQSIQSTRWTFDMENIMLVPCSQVKTGICSTVYNTLGGAVQSTTIRMVVAVGLRSASAARRRRRLLQVDSEEEEEGEAPDVHQDSYDLHGYDSNDHRFHQVLMGSDWNTTAPPCKQLAETYQGDRQALGVLEMYELQRCVFWRIVGRRVLERYNLTETPLGRRHETFLLSMDDLVQAVMSEEGAGTTLLRNPGVFGTALMYHPWMRPVRALGVIIANRLEMLRWVREIDFDVHEALFGDASEPDLADGDVLRQSQPNVLRRRFPDSDVSGDASQEPRDSGSEGGTGRGRKLLGVVDTVSDVEAYSAQIIQGPSSAAALGVPARVGGAWSTSTFSWPPVYNYRLETCPLAMSALDIGRQAVGVMALYFKNFGSQRTQHVDQSLRGNLPDFSRWIDEAGTILVGGAQNISKAVRSNWASWTFHLVLDLSGIRPSHLVELFTSNKKWGVQWVIETSLKCDLAAVVTCSGHNKDLVMSTVVFVLMYVFIVRPVTRVFGMGFLSVLYTLSYPWFILWYVFGMAPSCFPMVPTCLLSDTIATLERLVPSAIVFPEDLQCDSGKGNQTCLRSCEELNFTGWEDPLAFAVCDTDLRTCRYMHGLFPQGTGIAWVDTLILAPLQLSMRKFEQVVARGTVSGLAGHRLCTWVSFVTATPVLALFGVVVVLASAVCMAVLDLIPFAVGFMGQLYVFYTAGGG